MSDRLEAGAICAPGVEVRVLERCTSTNTLLMSEPACARPVLLAADLQTHGRGRRGRRWHGAPGASIAFSLACRLGRPARELAALPLAAGVAVARALRGMGARDVRLKWPNDLLVDGRKLGGILVETRAGAGETLAVLGIGLNWRPLGDAAPRLRRPAATLEEQLSPLPRREAVIGRVAVELLEALAAFQAAGLEALRGEWEALHAHAGTRLRVRLPGGRVLTGVAEGLAEDGGLRLRTRRGVRAVRSGTVVAAGGA